MGENYSPQRRTPYGWRTYVGLGIATVGLLIIFGKSVEAGYHLIKSDTTVEVEVAEEHERRVGNSLIGCMAGIIPLGVGVEIANRKK